MTGFSAAWLALREPADRRARDSRLVELLRTWRGDRACLKVVDLGSGTGANLRALAPRLGGPQSWCLVERDPDLLGRARAPAVAGLAVEHLALDLRSAAAAGALGACDLVTASALLDLVSRSTAEALVARVAATGTAFFAALSYDGRIAWRPAEPLDETVRDLVNRHQRGDKGFGPALGPRATGVFAELFARAGYRVETAPSDWRLGSDDAALQGVLLDGWLGAAGELDPAAPGRLTAWAARRRALITDHGATLEVGHLDLFARP